MDDVEKTQYKGHAVRIAENNDIDAFNTTACYLGEVLPHKVFNNLGRKLDAVAF